LECGASRTALGVFRLREGRLVMTRHAEVTLPESAGGGGDDWLQRARASIRRLRDEVGWSAPCVLVVPPHLVLTKFIQLPRVKAAQREQIIRFESEQSLPVALSDLVWDSIISAELGAGVEVMVIAGHVAKIEALCAAAQAAGFAPQRVLPAPVATLTAFRARSGGAAEPAAVINMGARSTTLLLIEPNRFLARTFAFGATTPGDEGRPLDGVMIATRLAQELARSILYFRRQGEVADPAKVFLAGGGARLAAMPEALAEKLGLPVEVVDCTRQQEVGAARPMPIQDPQPQLMEIVGAAAICLQEKQSAPDLLPARRRPASGHRRRQVALAVASLALAAACGWVGLNFSAAKPMTVQTAPAAMADVPVSAEESRQESAPPESAPLSSDRGLGAPVELIDVRIKRFPLQLAGYFGGDDRRVVALKAVASGETFLVRPDDRLERYGLTLRGLEMRKVPIAHEGGWSVQDAVGVAILEEDGTGLVIELDSRGGKPPDVREAVVRLANAEGLPAVLAEGESLDEGAVTYRLESIRTEPLEVTVAVLAPDSREPEMVVVKRIETLELPNAMAAEREGEVR
jgi:type IV pilus assembly protein PilM